MQRAQFFDGSSFKDIAIQVDAFFVANPGFAGISISIEAIGSRYQAVLMYTP